MLSSLIIVVAVLAFVVAMVALWLVSDVIKKVEVKLEGFVHTYIAPIHEEILKTNQAFSKVVKDVDGLTKRVASIDLMAGRIAKVAEDLDKLDRSIPKRFRAGVVPPEGADEKPATKPKAPKPKRWE